jgi:Gpi18-like mannosyltransferase
LVAGWGSIDGSVVLRAAGSYAMVLVALALFRRSHGNLLPLVLLFTTATVASIAALWSVRLQTGLAYDIVLIGLQWLAAGVFVVTDGLWRRPARRSEAVAVAALP